MTVAKVDDKLGQLDKRVLELDDRVAQLGKRVVDLDERVAELERVAERRDRDLSWRMRIVMNHLSDLDSTQRAQGRLAAALPTYSMNELRPDINAFNNRGRDVKPRSPLAQ